LFVSRVISAAGSWFELQHFIENFVYVKYRYLTFYTIRADLGGFFRNAINAASQITRILYYAYSEIIKCAQLAAN